MTFDKDKWMSYKKVKSLAGHSKAYKTASGSSFIGFTDGKSGVRSNVPRDSDLLLCLML